MKNAAFSEITPCGTYKIKEAHGVASKKTAFLTNRKPACSEFYGSFNKFYLSS
jgi:hypothetical protein